MQRGGDMNNRVAMHQACASCKHQRKRCGEDCVLAPYFPAERTQEFQAVHKVFGVSNVIKLVKDVNKERQKETAESLVWEATCRRNDPVLGCYGKFKRLQEEFELYKMQQPLLNQNMLRQQQQQRVVGAVYSKQPPLVLAWNGAGGIGNRVMNGGGGGGYGDHDSSDLIADSIPHNIYPWQYVQGHERSNQERDASSLLLPIQPSPPPPPPHPFSVHGFDQPQYYHPGQFGSMNGKSMDNTLFMGEEDGP
ncbi:hypothetical protein OIU84_017253 [Salix udensis]|uniref:LOB domain-containing protein n=1 Tax=Salix udensis TaxID=889485 RepID=A0AAD6PLL2_9ROSI|nr:hypothetical protein OIU84_017253 [Salix udensis]